MPAKIVSRMMAMVLAADDFGTVLVTGACGQIGGEVCCALREATLKVLPTDIGDEGGQDVMACDLRSKSDVSRLFQHYPIRAVIHLAGILPSAFLADPVLGIEVNVSGSVELLRQSAAAGVKRFLFASSMSVYGTSPTQHPLSEQDPATPDDPYGGSKRAVELIGETLAKNGAFEFVSLRIARVVGSGIKRSSSLWRAQIVETSVHGNSIRVPFSPKARLSLVHAAEVARMFSTLVRAAEIRHSLYNTPVEIWEAKQLKEVLEELRGIRMELGPEQAHGGPQSDGSRFAQEFGFQLRGLREYLELLPSSRSLQRAWQNRSA